MTKAAEARDLGGFHSAKKREKRLDFALLRGEVDACALYERHAPRPRGGQQFAPTEVVLETEIDGHRECGCLTHWDEIVKCERAISLFASSFHFG